MLRLKQSAPILLILLFALAIRLFGYYQGNWYTIRDYQTFLGDQGRDVLVVKRMLVDRDPTFLGPTASVGGFFLGPFYYYLMTPALALSGLDPVGPAIMVALFGVATVYLCYYYGRTFFNKHIGLAFAGLYAVSPLVVEYSRSSWNPNVLPFFSVLLLIACTHLVHNSFNKRILFFVIGACLGIIIQLHYWAGVTYFFAGLAYISYLILHKKNLKIREEAIRFGLGIVGFLAFFGPFLAFEATHGFLNFKNIIDFLLNREGGGFGGEKTWFIYIIWDVIYRLYLRIPAANNDILAQIMIVSTLVGLGLYLANIRNQLTKKINLTTLILFFWVAIGILVWGLYNRSIHDYYFSYMYPLPVFAAVLSFFAIFHYAHKKEFARRNMVTVVLTSILITALWYWFEFTHTHRRSPAYAVPYTVAFTLFLCTLGTIYHKLMKIIVATLLISLFSLSFILNTREVMAKMPGRQIYRTQTLAQGIIDNKNPGKYNFALITPGNSDHAYRYFLEIWNQKPTPLEEEVTSQLMVLCEEPKCEPLGNSLWEVAGFGQATIAGEWEVIGLKIYRLEHLPETKYLEGKPAPKGY